MSPKRKIGEGSWGWVRRNWHAAQRAIASAWKAEQWGRGLAKTKVEGQRGRVRVKA